MRKVFITYKVGKLTIKIPNDLKVTKKIDLDKFLNISEEKADVFLELVLNRRKYAIIIEDTGRPKVSDLKRLCLSEYLLRSRGEIGNHAVIKILHHCGVKSGKGLYVNLARSYKVHLSECKHRSIDLSKFILTSRM